MNRPVRPGVELAAIVAELRRLANSLEAGTIQLGGYEWWAGYCDVTRPGEVYRQLRDTSHRQLLLTYCQADEPTVATDLVYPWPATPMLLTSNKAT